MVATHLSYHQSGVIGCPVNHTKSDLQTSFLRLMVETLHMLVVHVINYGGCRDVAYATSLQGFGNSD